MDDQFLYQAKPDLDDDFADHLYQKINQRSTIKRHGKRNTSRWVLRVSFVVLLLLSLGGIFSSITGTDIRALARSWRQRIQPASKLIGNIIVVDLPPASTAQPPQEPSGSVTHSPLIYISIEEIKEKTGLEVNIPTWAPEGCSLDPEAFTWENGEIPSATLVWNCRFDEGKQEIYLFVSDAPMIASLPSDSYDVVEVNEKPVLLIRGIWAATNETGDEAEWSLTEDMVRITWDDGKYLYEMWSPGTLVSDHELLRMVETIY